VHLKPPVLGACQAPHCQGKNRRKSASCTARREKCGIIQRYIKGTPWNEIPGTNPPRPELRRASTTVRRRRSRRSFSTRANSHRPARGEIGRISHRRVAAGHPLAGRRRVGTSGPSVTAHLAMRPDPRGRHRVRPSQRAHRTTQVRGLCWNRQLDIRACELDFGRAGSEQWVAFHWRGRLECYLPLMIIRPEGTVLSKPGASKCELREHLCRPGFTVRSLSVSPNGTALTAHATSYRAATAWLGTIGSSNPRAASTLVALALTCPGLC